MKIRQGFVSNSSSSSFICHTKLSIDEVNEILQEMLDFYNKIYNDEKQFHDVFDYTRKLDTEDIVNWNKDYGEYYCKLDEDDIGAINIRSCYDNSIPYTLFDFICEKFNGHRIHLG